MLSLNLNFFNLRFNFNNSRHNNKFNLNHLNLKYKFKFNHHKLRLNLSFQPNFGIYLLHQQFILIPKIYQLHNNSNLLLNKFHTNKFYLHNINIKHILNHNHINKLIKPIKLVFKFHKFKYKISNNIINSFNINNTNQFPFIQQLQYNHNHNLNYLFINKTQYKINQI